MHLAAATGGSCLTLSATPTCLVAVSSRSSCPSICRAPARPGSSQGARENPRCRAGRAGGSSSPATGDSNDRRVFDKFPGRPCSVEEAKEARDACNILDGKAREDCYSSFGCDGNRVEKYLDTVMDLEAHLPKGPDLTGMLRKAVAQMLMVLGLSVLMLFELTWNVCCSMFMGVRAVGSIVVDTLRSPWHPSDSDGEPMEEEGKLYTFDAETRKLREIHSRKSESGPPLPSGQ
mmetsp:Transcript_23743/g.65886  ORF Transcript_23743/g.65886 Transcript_23743/m.65886 type:complete len:233 (-) Transcript_23743:67-765(-)